MQINDMIHGFALRQITQVKEADGVFYEMEHVKTGARLGWLSTGDENKTFSITFKTIPENNTGVFHILEHSVLQGSRRYPIKAPFVELIKGSMNTFLNAMTFPDKTMFPVSSRNEKDFDNLMRVYLDSVFFPLIYQNENIFLQEGWHYESEAPGQCPFYNGVVLNEMRGANSSVDSLIFNKMQGLLFPGNGYQYVSGGNPDAIVDLTYEQFKDTHSRFYHPSNAIILLDGAMDIEKVLGIIDQEYLSLFDKVEKEFPLPYQIGDGLVSETYDYAIEDASNPNQGYLGLGYVAGSFDEVKKLMAVRILADYLAGNNDAPLCKAVLSRELGFDVSAQLVDSMLQPFLMVVVRNMNPDSRVELERVISQTLQEVKAAGLPKEQLDAILCQHEFAAKERDFGGYPAGLINSMNILDSWLYGGDPTANLKLEACFAELHNEIEAGAFDQYLEEILLDNQHTASVLMNPSTAFLEEEAMKEQARLEAFFAGCSESDQAELWEKQEQLKTYQARPNTPEECECLPGLALSDISEEPVAVDLKVLADGTLWHHGATKGIRYLRMYLQLDDVTEEELTEYSFLTGLYGSLPLTDMDKTTLDMKIRRTFGYFAVPTNVIAQAGAGDQAKAYACVEFSYLAEKEEEALELAEAILKKTDFSQVSYLSEILFQQQEGCLQTMIMDGHNMAMLQAKAAVSQIGKLENANDGPVYANWINMAIGAISTDGEGFCKHIVAMAEKMFTAGNVIVSMTSDGEERGYAEVAEKLLPLNPGKEIEVPAMPMISEEGIVGDMLDDIVGDMTYDMVDNMTDDMIDNMTDNMISDMTGIMLSEGMPDNYIVIPAPIAYCAMAGNLTGLPHINTGAWNVLSKLASMDYLWTKIRVQGGAYGAGMSVGYDGMASFYTYRDPNPKASVEIFKEVADYIMEYCDTNPDLTRIIIGSISATEQLMTPSTMGRFSDICYLSGLSDQARKERRMQILATTSSQLKGLAAELKSAMDAMEYCIVANPEVINECI